MDKCSCEMVQRPVRVHMKVLRHKLVANKVLELERGCKKVEVVRRKVQELHKAQVLQYRIPHRPSRCGNRHSWAEVGRKVVAVESHD